MGFRSSPQRTGASAIHLVNWADQKEWVAVHIHTCLAIRQLRDSKREILPCFCQHCYYLNQARAEAAGLSMKVEGGAGTCVHSYAPAGVLQQDLAEIKEVI